MKPSDDIIARANKKLPGPMLSGDRALAIAHSILEYLDDAHAGVATVSERERVGREEHIEELFRRLARLDAGEMQQPGSLSTLQFRTLLAAYDVARSKSGNATSPPSAVEPTVEEWEALEDCVSTDRGQYDANTRALAGEALRKLNVRAALDQAAISKSETPAAPQPATGDGTGEDEWEQDQPCPHTDDGAHAWLRWCSWCGETHALPDLMELKSKLAAAEQRMRTMESQGETVADQYERLEAKLRGTAEKLAAAETQRDEMREQFGVECAGREAAEQRAEKAEAWVRASAAVVAAAERAIIHHKNDRNRPWSITQLAEAFDAPPAELRTGVKP